MGSLMFKKRTVEIWLEDTEEINKYNALLLTFIILTLKVFKNTINTNYAHLILLSDFQNSFLAFKYNLEFHFYFFSCIQIDLK